MMLSHLSFEDMMMTAPSGYDHAGTGVFARRSLVPGILMPYTGIAKYVDSTISDHMVGSTYYRDGDCRQRRCLKGVGLDGNPRDEAMLAVNPSYTFAAFVNEHLESDSTNKVNCILVVNPFVTADDMRTSLHQQLPIVGAFMLIIRPVTPGQELLTHYGSFFSSAGSYTRSDFKVDERTRDFLSDVLNKFKDDEKGLGVVFVPRDIYRLRPSCETRIQFWIRPWVHEDHQYPGDERFAVRKRSEWSS